MMAKRLLTQAEKATYDLLKPLCEKWGTHVFIKVRLADVLPIENSGVNDSAFRFALQSHFDFVVADANYRPLFAVEFDGDTHTAEVQQQRDHQKNQLCERFRFPFLRQFPISLQPLPPDGHAKLVRQLLVRFSPDLRRIRRRADSAN